MQPNWQGTPQHWASCNYPPKLAVTTGLVFNAVQRTLTGPGQQWHAAAAAAAASSPRQCRHKRALLADAPRASPVSSRDASEGGSSPASLDLTSGPQRSIHTAAEQYLQQQDLHDGSSLQGQPPASLDHGPMSAAAVAAANEETSAVNTADIYKAIGISGIACVLAGILDHAWVDQHMGLSMSLLFGLGYLGIFVEEVVGLNKAGIALVMSVSLWTIYRDGAGGQVDAEIAAALASVSELIFFLLGAMTIVEVVDSHGGFNRLSAAVRADQRSTLAWLVAGLTFAMSAVLDNLTTTIVLVSVLQRAVPHDPELRKLLGAVVVIAANAGGAWTPIGDVTTTMLWIHGQLTPWVTMRDLLLPALVSTAVPVAALCARAPELQGPVIQTSSSSQAAGTAAAALAASTWQGEGPTLVQQLEPAAVAAAAAAPPADLQLEASTRDVLVLSVGLGALLFVPLFKYLTGLPPYMGMLSGLGILWMVTDALHFGENKQYPRVQDALRNLDIGGVMFFLGILLSVEALSAAGLLQLLAAELSQAVPDVSIIAAAIGVASAVIDNVPLVAATMGMYDLAQVPQDAQLWQLIALCAGTGGSLLVIGSAAGVAYMGLEGVGVVWWLRRVTPWALAGYAAANVCYITLHGLPPAL